MNKPNADETSAKQPRVVIADDSAFMRRLITDTLQHNGLDVVAVAANGREALDACKQHAPDVLCLDLAMPELDGIAVLRELGKDSKIRVVVVSSFSEENGMRAVDALNEGAFDLVPKLAGRGKLHDFTDQLVEKVLAAVATTLSSEASGQAIAPVTSRATGSAATAPTASGPRAVVVASSTGGPRVLTAIITALPATIGLGVVVVQHMPAGFTQSLAARLDGASAIGVHEATDGVKLDANSVLVAPGGRHTHLVGNQIELTDEPAIGGLRPCADVTIADVVETYGANVLLVVLTGMGRDGQAGARLVRAAGGMVIAQNGASCTVYGMPRAVIEAGLADLVLPIEELAQAIAKHSNG
ncbi:MAG: chemotaxis-specific protein-glutamate methyltransferase CheB [Thermoleophilaceae bacterium]|nr:chemotaxis-specific protein-glutamate methyltransferase CheB [Thermoleophilaceae bacterium]